MSAPDREHRATLDILAHIVSHAPGGLLEGETP
jgi:hypothetical protein